MLFRLYQSRTTSLEHSELWSATIVFCTAKSIKKQMKQTGTKSAAFFLDAPPLCLQYLIAFSFALYHTNAVPVRQHSPKDAIFLLAHLQVPKHPWLTPGWKVILSRCLLQQGIFITFLPFSYYFWDLQKGILLGTSFSSKNLSSVLCSFPFGTQPIEHTSIVCVLESHGLDDIGWRWLKGAALRLAGDNGWVEQFAPN